MLGIAKLPRSAHGWQSRRTSLTPANAQNNERIVTSTSLLAASLLGGSAYAADVQKVDNGWLSPIVDSLDFVLGNIESFYASWGLPYAYGWSIVSLTLFVKLLTLPLTKKQVESAMAVQSMKPRIDVIKERYGDDKDKIQKETSRLYEQAEVNPLAGCLPSILQLPIFIGLYRSLNNVALSGSLDNEGFFWIPSLAGPVDAATRSNGGSTSSWLLPFVDGAPPIGWHEASLYLVLPVLLVAAQYASSAILSPVDPNDENANTQRVLIYLLPLTIGWFSLNVPSGLSLYYFSNSFFTSAQQIYFRKLGGVTVDTPDLGPVTKLGMGRRQGEVVNVPKAASALPEAGAMGLAAEFGGGMSTGTPDMDMAALANEALSEAANGAGATATLKQSQNGSSEGSSSNGTEGSAAPATQQEIVGGLAFSDSEMEGVSPDELQVLKNRSKRRMQTA